MFRLAQLISPFISFCVYLPAELQLILDFLKFIYLVFIYVIVQYFFCFFYIILIKT